MKKVIVVALIAATLAGCQSNPSQGELLGAGAGMLIGSRFGGGTGRLVATGVGGLIGAGVGRALDNQPQNVYIQNQQIGVDSCVNHQIESGMPYGQAASYCQGRRQRFLEEQSRMQQDAWRRGYNGY